MAVVGDLSNLEETRGVAGQVNRLGQMDAVIHNAGVLSGPNVLPVNVGAPYLLTALIHRPEAAGLPQQRHAPRRSSQPDRHRLERPPRDKLLFGTASSSSPRSLGADEDGRPGTSPRNGSRPAMTLRRAPPAATGITSAGSIRPAASMTSGSKANCSRNWPASPVRRSLPRLPDARSGGMNRALSRRNALVLALLATVSRSACGGDEEDSDQGAGASDASAPSTSPSPPPATRTPAPRPARRFGSPSAIQSSPRGCTTTPRRAISRLSCR